MNIDELCSQVEHGTSRRFNCPLCNGSNSLSITKDNGRVYYKCFKASCILRGRKNISMNSAEIKSVLEGRTEEIKPFTIPDYWIMGLASKKCVSMLIKGNSLEAYQAGLFKVAYDPKLDRLVYLIQDDKGNIVGGVGRALSGQTPKAFNYPGSAKLPFKCGTGDTAVLVEDCASACSIGILRKYTGIALLGTDIRTEHSYNIYSIYNNIIIALDKDAIIKSIILKNKISYYKDNIIIWKLYKDLKDMNKEEIIEFIDNKSNIIV